MHQKEFSEVVANDTDEYLGVRVYVCMTSFQGKEGVGKKQSVRFAGDTEIDVPQDADSTRNSDSKIGILNIG